MEIIHSIEQDGKIEYVNLLDLYGSEIYRLCYSLTYCVADAEDLFQDTFLHMLIQQNRGRVLCEPRKFLYTTVLYNWKSAKRKYARRQCIAPTQPLQDTITSDEHFELTVEDKEAAEAVRSLVASLPDKYRIPTTLHYSCDMPILEIAETMGIAEGTIKSRLFKARKMIEKGLGNQL